MPADPYRTLGVARNASDAEVRAAYRRLVQLHHPDHNNGSAESARRFEEVQEAYAQIRAARSGTGARPAGASRSRPGPGSGSGPGPKSRPRPAPGSSPPPRGNPDLDARMAEMERQLREAQLARERARQAAREAAASAGAASAGAASAGAAASAGRPRRPTDEELGYVTTDDSLSKILADARSEIAQRYSEAREHPVTKRVSDLIDELAAKLTGEEPPRGR